MSDGYTRFVIGGRMWVGKEIAGSKALSLRRRLLPIFNETIWKHRPGVSQGAAVILSLQEMEAHPDCGPLVDETIDGYTVDGVPYARDRDTVLRGRASDAFEAAVEVWEREGFFSRPGAERLGIKPAKEAAPQATPEPPPLPDAV